MSSVLKISSMYILSIIPPWYSRQCAAMLSVSYCEYAWHHQTSNIRRAKSQNLNVSLVDLQLTLSNTWKPGVKSRMKMLLEQRLLYQRCYGNYIWIIVMLMDIVFHRSPRKSLKLHLTFRSILPICFQYYLTGYFYDDIRTDHYNYLSDLYHTLELIATIIV